MPEQLTQISDQITLCHESFGDPSDPSVLLVMGLGTQMIAWHDDFCVQLAGRGFHVTRFDKPRHRPARPTSASARRR